MPLLVCSAQKCVYNNGMCCSKGDIKVGGQQAMSHEETCCESFKERTASNATSSMGSPSQTINVTCEACECCYNKDCNCDAGKIDIAGAGACNCKQTECSTFHR